MSIAAQNPLNLEDIKFDQPGGPVRFDNPSDTIFASLFLPVSSDEDGSNSVPWQFCDRILSAIRSPRFNSKEVTFNSCGDMLRSVGGRRHDMWSVVEARPTSSSFPMVILDCVLDCLQAEMASRTLLETTEEEEWEWTETLHNMVFVHSSWHASVKRLLGRVLVSPCGPTPTAIQNPIFGEWTREMHLTFHEEGDDLVDERSKVPTEPQIYFMDSLFTRLSNVRLVNIRLAEISDIVMAPICKALLNMHSLEEVIVEAVYDSDELPVHAILSAISDARHPTLRILRLHAALFNLDNLLIPIFSLAPLGMLHSVELLWRPLRAYQPIGVSRVLWSRDPSERGSHFNLIDMRIDCVSGSALNIMHSPRGYELDVGIAKLLRSSELVSFRFILRKRQALDHKPSTSRTAPSNVSHLLGPWLAQCSSAHKITFHGFIWSHARMFAPIHEQFGALAGVRELVIEVAPLPSPSNSASSKSKCKKRDESLRTQFPLNEAALSQVLGAGLFPSLLALKVTFPEHALEVFIQSFGSKVMHLGGGSGLDERRMLLPHCRQRCSERSIVFNVDIVWESSKW